MQTWNDTCKQASDNSSKKLMRIRANWQQMIMHANKRRNVAIQTNKKALKMMDENRQQATMHEKKTTAGNDPST